MNDKRPAASPSGFSALPSGTVLDRYRIDSVIGAGGFGVTYHAHHVGLAKPYAIKEHFPRQFAHRDGSSADIRPTDPAIYSWTLDRFLQEGRSLARCRHPNIPAVADVFEANGTAYMVLDFVEGQSLKAWLQSIGRSPSQDEIDLMTRGVLDALEHIHGLGVLHRDIAPDNIMLRDDGSACLIDFGAARIAAAERSEVMSAIVKGGFSPPEQYTQSSRGQGPWSDIYAFAATLYRAVTGRAPTEATQRLLDDDLGAVRDALPATTSYRAGFLDGIDHGLQLKPANRPASVKAWRSELMGAEPVPAAPRAEQAAIPVRADDVPPTSSGNTPQRAPVAPAGQAIELQPTASRAARVDTQAPLVARLPLWKLMVGTPLDAAFTGLSMASSATFWRTIVTRPDNLSGDPVMLTAFLCFTASLCVFAIRGVFAARQFEARTLMRRQFAGLGVWGIAGLLTLPIGIVAVFFGWLAGRIAVGWSCVVLGAVGVCSLGSAVMLASSGRVKLDEAVVPLLMCFLLIYGLIMLISVAIAASKVWPQKRLEGHRL